MIVDAGDKELVESYIVSSNFEVPSNIFLQTSSIFIVLLIAL